jgi:hypothetical protein
MHGNNTRKLLVYLSLSQTAKTSCFHLSFTFFSSSKSGKSVLRRGEGVQEEEWYPWQEGDGRERG